MHYTDHSSFTAAFLGFAQLCRARKLNVGIHENQEAMLAAVQGLWGDFELFRYGLKSIFCTSSDEGVAFDKLYDKYWSEKMGSIKGKTTFKNQSNLIKDSKGSLVMVGIGNEEDDNEETDARNTAGANTKETLRKTDFAKVEQIDSQLLEDLAEQLWRQMSLRLKRKYKKGQKGNIHIQSTIRRNISNGGTMLNLIRKDKKQQKYKLIILLDVSGSMDKYSFYLLKFIHTLRANFDHVEAFVFSTRLIQITEFLNRKNLRESLALLSYHAHNWSSGTKIGECLKTFNDQFAKRLLNGKTLTIVLSDGLDTGEPEDLKRELDKIKLRTKKLVWLNPLKGMTGYQPIQRGMKTALPVLHHFGAAHNIESLLALENILSDA